MIVQINTLTKDSSSFELFSAETKTTQNGYRYKSIATIEIPKINLNYPILQGETGSVEEIGLDDVSIRKGMKYATVIYDMKDHHMLALLDGRDGKTLKEWLRNHKKIKKIARDRATAYANAINEVLPETIQIADRFHLFQNLVERFKEIFKCEVPENIYILNGQILDEKPKDLIVKATVESEILENFDYDDTPPVDENGNIIEFNEMSSDPNDKNHLIQAENRKKKLN